MDITRLLTSAILAFFGFALVLYLFALLFRPLFHSVIGKKYSSKLKKAADKLAQFDSLFAAHQHAEALRVLRRAPLVEIFDRPQLLDPAKEHNQNILSRCVLLAEELQTRVNNLPETERLVIERSELLTLFVRACESFASLRNRRERAGKEIPSWTKSDFENRIKEIRKELDANGLALNASFEKLFDSIGSPPREEDIVYH